MQVNLSQQYAVYDYQSVANTLSEGIAVTNEFLDNVLVMHRMKPSRKTVSISWP